MASDSPKNILLIEDDLEIQEVIVEFLKAEGLTVTLANTGEAGLNSLNEDPPDLILLDVGLPDLDGWQVCQQIKANPDTAGIPLFFLTARDAPIHHMVGKGILKADEYLVKPIKFDDLLSLIKRHLKN